MAIDKSVNEIDLDEPFDVEDAMNKLADDGSYIIPIGKGQSMAIVLRMPVETNNPENNSKLFKYSILSPGIGSGVITLDEKDSQNFIAIVDEARAKGSRSPVGVFETNIEGEFKLYTGNETFPIDRSSSMLTLKTAIELNSAPNSTQVTLH